MDKLAFEFGMNKAKGRSFYDCLRAFPNLPSGNFCAIIKLLSKTGDKELSDLEPIISLRPRQVSAQRGRSKNHNATASVPPPPQVSFDRHELNTILSLYGHHVAAGNWRDYAIDFGCERAVFSIFKRTSERPLYRVEKDPRLARKQGTYSITDQTGRILKRGHDLSQVLKILALKPKLSVV